MTTAPMTSKTHRPIACPYGCCVPDYFGTGKANRRLVTRRSKRREARAWKREVAAS